MFRGQFLGYPDSESGSLLGLRDFRNASRCSDDLVVLSNTDDCDSSDISKSSSINLYLRLLESP